jgi:hypothetical protein
VGDGRQTFSWTDRWLQGKSLADLVPNLVIYVPKRFLKNRVVRDTLHNNQWVQDISGDLSLQALYEFFMTWDILAEVKLDPEFLDQHLWFPSTSGVYS